MPYPDLTQEELEKELHIMRNPDAWPIWPRLPLKRSMDQKPCIGFLRSMSLHEDTVDPVVVCHAVFAQQPVGGWHVLTYESLEDLVADGWRVD